MSWRNSKLFNYGYYPFRLLFVGLAYIFRALFAAACFMCWFEAETFRQVLKRTR